MSAAVPHTLNTSELEKIISGQRLVKTISIIFDSFIRKIQVVWLPRTSFIKNASPLWKCSQKERANSQSKSKTTYSLRSFLSTNNKK